MNDLLTVEDFIAIGYIGGLHGYDGTVRLILDLKIENLADEQLTFLYFKVEGMFVPRFIRSWDKYNSLIRFDRILAREEARKLTDQKVFLRKRDFRESNDNVHETDLKWDVLQGYQIFDIETNNAVGVISTIEEYPAGWMAEVQHHSESDPFLIPLAEPLIDRVDQDSQILYMNLPDGLVDLKI